MSIFDIFRRRVIAGTIISKEYRTDPRYALIIRGSTRPGGPETVRRVFVPREVWKDLNIGDRYDERNIT